MFSTTLIRLFIFGICSAYAASSQKQPEVKKTRMEGVYEYEGGCWQWLNNNWHRFQGDCAALLAQPKATLWARDADKEKNNRDQPRLQTTYIGQYEAPRVARKPLPSVPQKTAPVPKQQQVASLMVPSVQTQEAPKLALAPQELPRQQVNFMDDNLYDLFKLPYNMPDVCHGKKGDTQQIAMNISAVWSLLLSQLESKQLPLAETLDGFINSAGVIEGYKFKRQLQIKLINLVVNQVVLNPQFSSGEKGLLASVLLLPIYARAMRESRGHFAQFFELIEKASCKSTHQHNLSLYEQWFMYCKYLVVCRDDPSVFNRDYMGRFPVNVDPKSYFKSNAGWNLSFENIQHEAISDPKLVNVTTLLLEKAPEPTRHQKFWG
jgi:hypothetical protein